MYDDLIVPAWAGKLSPFVGECPAGHVEHVELRGRTVFGLPANGTNAANVGNQPLSNQETRLGGSAAGYRAASVNYARPSLSGGGVRYTAPSLRGGSVTYTAPSLSGGSATYTAPSLSGGGVRYSRPSLSGGGVTYSRPTVTHQHRHAYTDTIRGTLIARLDGGSSNIPTSGNETATTRFTAGVAATASGDQPAQPVVSGGGASYTSPTLSGGGVSYTSPTLSGGGVSYTRPSLSSGGVRYTAPSLSSGGVTYTRPTFSGGTLTFTSGNYVDQLPPAPGRQYRWCEYTPDNI